MLVHSMIKVGKAVVAVVFEFSQACSPFITTHVTLSDSDCVKWADKIEPKAVVELLKTKERIDSECSSRLDFKCRTT